jgi:GTP-binding protein HflX
MIRKNLAEKVILAGLLFPEDLLDEEEILKEFETLVYSAGAISVGKAFQHRQSYDPAYGIGKGKMEEVLLLLKQTGAKTVLFLNNLTPVQQRNLEKAFQKKVVDRTALILDIFAQRARTKEGKLQVELAQLKYQLPRLSEIWETFSRLGGGIGTRGPGEQKLESDRRKIQDRIRKLESEIKKVRKHRELLREGRKRKNLLTASLIGYTNSGKTSLLNALTGSRAYVAEKFFATLDPLVRKLTFNNDKPLLLTDTVGFLKNLPPQLITAFKATLEELEESDLLIHVLDGSNPQNLKLAEDVQEILEELNLMEKPVILVINKSDKINSASKKELQESFPDSFFVSALTGKGLEELKTALQNAFHDIHQSKENDDKARAY